MRLSVYARILIFIAILLILVILFNRQTQTTESFVQQKQFLFNKDIYDDFYSSIYDMLVYNFVKNDYEVGQIMNYSHPSQVSVVADIGCGTGHHVALLNDNGVSNITGIDQSASMIKKAKENYPNLDFRVGDATNSGLFYSGTLTHITCLYFTIYYFTLFVNCEF